MTMSVTYTTFAGMIVHENRGGEERFYSPDTLGSTQALYDETGTVTDTFEYWPYGEIRTRTGTTPTPFTFVGVFGYFMDTLARLYVRARHYLTQPGRWLTVDPLWPMQAAYLYVRLKPSKLSDPSGLLPGLISLAGQCGMGALAGIGIFLQSLYRGNPVDYKGIACSFGPACAGAVIAFIITAALGPEAVPLSLCLGGALGNALAQGVGAALCDPPRPCRTTNDLICIGLSALQSGLTGCLSALAGGIGMQVGDVLYGMIINFFGSEFKSGCRGNPAGGSGPGLVPY